VSLDGVHRVLPGEYRVSVGAGQPDTGVPIETGSFTIKKAATLFAFTAALGRNARRLPKS